MNNGACKICLVLFGIKKKSLSPPIFHYLNSMNIKQFPHWAALVKQWAERLMCVWWWMALLLHRKGETQLRSPNTSHFLVLSIAYYIWICALKANSARVKHVYPVMFVQLKAPVFKLGPSGQCWYLASSPLGVFSHEELKNVNSPMRVPGSLAEVGSSWLCWGLFPRSHRDTLVPFL